MRDFVGGFRRRAPLTGPIAPPENAPRSLQSVSSVQAAQLRRASHSVQAQLPRPFRHVLMPRRVSEYEHDAPLVGGLAGRHRRAA
jgi:hypothetical protein